MARDLARGTVHDPWETQDENARREFIAGRLDAYIRYAREAVPFYRDRLAPYAKGSNAPLRGIPVLTSEELRRRLPPESSDLIAEPRRAYSVFQSGGTTGSPKTSLFSHEELDRLDLPNARGFHAVGLSASDRVANLFAVGSLYMTFIHINRILQQYGCTNFPFSNHTPVDVIHAAARSFKINVLAGITSVVLNALRGFLTLGTDDLGIEKVYYGGEHIYESDMAEIAAHYGTRIIAAPGYGTIDSWYIGYQCAETPHRVFHAHDDQTYIEIVDEETGTPCDPGASGMIYATAFERTLTPIVRYRVGDRAVWMGNACPCGRTTPLFKLLGRGDDTLRIGFDFVDYQFVQETVAGVPGLSSAVRMEKDRRDGKDRLILTIETEIPEERHPEMSRVLASRIVEERPTLRKAIEGKTVLPLEIRLVPPGGIPRNPRTGKLVRVIDAIGEDGS